MMTTVPQTPPRPEEAAAAVPKSPGSSAIPAEAVQSPGSPTSEAIPAEAVPKSPAVPANARQTSPPMPPSLRRIRQDDADAGMGA